jgi:hypothetical protein
VALRLTLTAKRIDVSFSDSTLGYSQEVQVSLFDQFVDQATERLKLQFSDPVLSSVVKRVAKDRLLVSIESFGDTGWRKHPDDLMIEIIEELADAIVYSVMRENARSGGPGSHYG